MKAVKGILFLVLLTTSIYLSKSQPILNGGFENWDTTGMYEDPEGYSTSNMMVYAQIGQANVIKQTPAFSGKYSVWLETMTIQIFYPTAGYLIYGNPTDFLQSGDISDIKGGFPYSQMPDSFIFNARHQCINGDTAYVILILKKNIGGKSESLSVNFYKIIGVQNNYVRYSFPVSKPAIPEIPDTAIIYFSSSNPLYTDSINTGNWIEIDKINFIMNTGKADDIPNSDFEKWNIHAGIEPEGWLTYNFIDLVMMFQPQGVVPFSPGHSGKLAVKISSNLYTFGGLPPDTMGMILLGDPNAQNQGMSITEYPDSLSFWYRYNNDINKNDNGFAFVAFSKYNNETKRSDELASFTTKLSATSEYLLTNVHFESLEGRSPDTMILIMSASKLEPTGRGVGNYLIIDDLVLWYHHVGIPVSSNLSSNSFIYPNPADNYVNVAFELTASSDIVISLADMNGKTVLTRSYNLVPGKQDIRYDLNNLPTGQYMLIIADRGHSMYSRKLLINR